MFREREMRVDKTVGRIGAGTEVRGCGATYTHTLGSGIKIKIKIKRMSREGGLVAEVRKRRQAGRTPNASRQSTPRTQFALAFGVRPACRRSRTPHFDRPSAATLSGLDLCTTSIPQGSSFFATLGFVAESLWDSLESLAIQPELCLSEGILSLCT